MIDTNERVACRQETIRRQAAFVLLAGLLKCLVHLCKSFGWRAMLYAK